MLKAAITGNIASGKSQVEKIISKKYPVYDADKIAHKILENLKDFYGYDVFTDGKIDRKKLGELVFSNPDLKKKLEEIIHPQVKQEILKIFEQDLPVVFISIPLLFETGFDRLFDKIIFVSADSKLRLERLMKRNNFTKEEALRRIQSQGAEEEKIQKSDFVICNNSTLTDLKTQTDLALAKIINA